MTVPTASELNMTVHRLAIDRRTIREQCLGGSVLIGNWSITMEIANQHHLTISAASVAHDKQTMSHLCGTGGKAKIGPQAGNVTVNREYRWVGGMTRIRRGGRKDPVVAVRGRGA
jgi:hypothetical protein